MKITPVKGTNDYLPNEVEIRDYLQNEILKVYVANGFEHITTPIIEDIENLDKSDGGENLNLIFKIMKRGDKLEKAVSSLQENPKTGTACENEIADMGLRYDLTLPLSRYFANNKDKLTLPMKCIQMDRVYRAERPQKGRLREFVQCDIDIIGSDSTDSEVELILTTTKALKAIGMKNFKVKINDRRLLRSFLQNCGFTEDQLDSVCITFDKMDKVGLDGVKAELTDKGFDAAAIEKFIGFFGSVSSAQEISLESVEAILDDKAPAESVRGIINTVNELSDGQFDVVFDLSLVRGQGYYTGTVFEVESIDFKGAIAGGGRYDNLIGKFLGQQVSAVGFSIGFERIFSILMQNGVETKGFDAAAIEKFIGFFGSVSSAQEISLESVEAILDDKAPAESVRGIINTVNELSDGQFDVVFDLSLVRGQGYYTGTVFEVESIDFKGAIAGGGRYDNLIGKFLGQQVSAVGFSIGFERIFSILMQNGVETKASADKIAVMYDEGQVKEAYAIAEKYRAEGKVCSLYVKPKKMGKFLGKLEERGYKGFVNVSNGDEISLF